MYSRKIQAFRVLECHLDTAKMIFSTVSKCSGAVWVWGIVPLAKLECKSFLSLRRIGFSNA